MKKDATHNLLVPCWKILPFSFPSFLFLCNAKQDRKSSKANREQVIERAPQHDTKKDNNAPNTYRNIIELKCLPPLHQIALFLAWKNATILFLKVQQDRRRRLFHRFL